MEYVPEAACRPEANYRHLGNKRRKQHYLSVLVERLAGKDPKAIAESLHMTEGSVRRDLEYVQRNWSLISPDGSGNGATKAAKRPSSISRIKMLEAKCEGCGALIRKGDERVVLAAFVMDYLRLDEETELDNSWLHLDAEESGHVSNADLRNVFHYCTSCGTTEEVRVCNPWRVRATAEQIEWMKKCEAEGLAESAAENELLSQAVAAGDMHAINRAMPTTPKRNDVMARATEFSQITIREKDDETGEPKTLEFLEVADRLASTDSPDHLDSPYGTGSHVAGEAAQRAKLLPFLNAQAFKDKFKDPNKRTAFRMWAEGASQMEVQRKCGIDQGNFSKMKKVALAMAHKA